MFAAIIKKYGDASQLIIQETPDPKMADDEVLIQIKASSVNPIDWKIRQGSLRWIHPIPDPKILGFDLSGVIIMVGKEVKTLKKGDEVYACSPKKSGQAYAQLIALKETDVSLKPQSLSFAQAASIPLAALTAFQALCYLGQMKAGYRVLIIGASGGVGHIAVQIAKAKGAIVTAVCSGANIPFVQTLGVDKIIDYKTQNVFSKHANYDIIFDCVAAHSFSKAQQSLCKKGIYISTLPSFSLVCRSLLNRFSSQKSKFILMKAKKSDLDAISTLVINHQLTPKIDSEFSIHDCIKAHLRSETHHAIGKIVINIQ